MSRLAAPFQVIFNREPRRFELFRFLTNVDRAGVLRSPPMIQDARDMMNAPGLLDHAKEEVVILRAIEL